MPLGEYGYFDWYWAGTTTCSTVQIESKPAAYLARGLYYVLPNFAAFDVKTQVVHALPVTSSYVATTAVYGAVYVSVLLTAAVMVFSRRDFK